ncbi:MAG: hypothetical protein GXP54_10060 [Deltaproteobacteria bacterium]|nr:hypothetical protein [Deltaproteobacteria bacterium]
MRRQLGRTVIYGLMCVMLVSMTALISCPSEQPQSLLIKDFMAMTSQQQCSIRPGSGAQTIRPYGILDLAIGNTYWLFPRFVNQMPTLAETSGEGPQTMVAKETNFLSVFKAETKIAFGPDFVNASDPTDQTSLATIFHSQQEMEKWLAILNQWSDNWTQSIVAAGAEPSAEGIVAVQAIRPDLGNAMFDRIFDWITRKLVTSPGYWLTLKVRIKAMTQDMKEITSNVMWFPVEICWCCLCQCDTNHPDVPSSNRVPCFPGQDDALPATLWPMLADHPECCLEKCWGPPPWNY